MIPSRSALRGTLARGLAAAALTASIATVACSRSTAPPAPGELRMGIAQLGLRARLEENRSRMLELVDQAKSQGCRLVVFPESALSGQSDDPAGEMTRSVAALARAADAADVY